MPDLTIRDIPPDVLDKIKILSKTERRSINSEMLMVIEKGLKDYIEGNVLINKTISKEVQLDIWKNLSGKWEDERKTEDIINEIYEKRTEGRDVDL